MIEDVKTLLGNSAQNFTDGQINLCIRQATAEVEAYTNRVLDTELEAIVERIAIIKLNRLNTEGLDSQSFSGISEAYTNGYPEDIISILNRKRKIKML